jgi:RNA polymerase sigma-70 factor, ECF subfamily
MTSKEEDEALIAAALSGSVHAWEKLVKNYESRIYNFGLRLTGNASDAMDLMQEVFLGVYRNLHRFRGDARFSSWIFRIAHNKAIDLNRRKFLLAGQLDIDNHQQVQLASEAPGSEPDKEVMSNQTNREVQVLLQKLPLEQRLLVELKIFQSHTFEEIAMLQEISENTAKTRFYTALRKLKVAMEESDVLL